jgi:hypothetical protein
MPVPLILSDLPPKVEQPDASTVTAVEGEQIFTVESEGESLTHVVPLTGISLLSKEPASVNGIAEKQPSYAVLPNWLTDNGEALSSENLNGIFPGLTSSSGSGATPVVPSPDVEPDDNHPGEIYREGVPPFDNPDPSPNDSPNENTSPYEEQTPASLEVDGGTDLTLQADQQSYDPLQQMVTASGNVLVQFGDAQLAAERIWVNLENRYLRAEGDVFFNRNDQIIEGETATYNLLQGSGEIREARGELALATFGEDLATIPFADEPLSGMPIDYRLQQAGTISSVTSPGGVTFGTDSRRDLFGGEGGGVSRIRFEGDVIYFDADGWYAEDLRLTNDPFSPPELELRGNSVSLVPLNEEEAELYIEGPRLVFDQGLTLPLLKERYILQRGQLAADELNPLPTGIGIDGRDRDGLFVEREFVIDTDSPWRFTVVPQFYLGRWLGDSNYDLFDPANFGVVARANGPLGPRLSARGVISLPGLDLQNFSDRVRASFRTQQLIGDHRLSLEYSYRDRLFNGSLGFQDVQTSLGLLLQSPNIQLGNTGINLTYQASGQYVTADTDQPDLLPPGETFGLASLLRFQGAVDLSRGFTLWQGEPLPATQFEGLRYSPRPLVPFLSLAAGLRGVATYYTSDALQEILEARVTLSGQLGRLSRNYFDYTRFNIGYSTSFIGGDDSPFLFDRAVDKNVLSGGIIQQIYGPFLAGFQTSFNLDTGEEIDTDFILEYRRRAYGVFLQYSPSRETGFLGFRISDFDWTGRTRPFDADTVDPAIDEPLILVE